MMPCSRVLAAVCTIWSVVMPLFILASTSSDPDSAPQNTMVRPASRRARQVASEKRQRASTRASHHHLMPSGFIWPATSRAWASLRKKLLS